MIKELFTAITGLDADKYASDDSQTEWERRRYWGEMSICTETYAKD